MQSETAETLALIALTWLMGQDDLLPVFLGSTGASPDEVESRVDDPEFLASVLDFLTMDDRWIVAFCNSAGLDYCAPMEARQALPGGAPPYWT